MIERFAHPGYHINDGEPRLLLKPESHDLEPFQERPAAETAPRPMLAASGALATLATHPLPNLGLAASVGKDNGALQRQVS